MNILVIILIVAAAGMVLFALARGLYHFSQVRDAAVGADGPSEAHLKQNQMMFARVKWQAITILLLVILGAIAGSR